MSIKQQVVLVYCILSVALLCFVPGAAAEKDVAGKTFYTMANIWYEKPANILSTNYHRGEIIAVGSKVTIKRVMRKEIRFVDENGRDFRIIYASKHSRRGMTVWEYFDQYFSAEDPMRDGGPFYKLTKTEQENVREGILEEGMSKDAALMSYGYPPGHKTPSIKNNMWKYWVSRFVTLAVEFKDDKVISVRR